MKIPSPVADTPALMGQRFLELPATREVIPRLPTESFWWLEHDYPSEIARWNYHPEYEIHLIRRGTGNFIIGDQIGAFAPGHVALIGPNLPHDWMSNLEAGEVILDRDVVVQFNDEWVNNCIAVIPELGMLREVLDSSSRGILFSGETALAAAAEMELIGLAHGSRRVSYMFALLATLADAPASEKTFVSQEWFAASAGHEGTFAVEAGLAYIFENLADRIRMSEAAHRAHMSESTFSKYFKKTSGLTFSEMVRKLRIANACRLLAGDDTSVSAICQAVGYDNLANFNRQFLTEMNMTPSAYRKLDVDERPRGDAPRLGLKTPMR